MQLINSIKEACSSICNCLKGNDVTSHYIIGVFDDDDSVIAAANAVVKEGVAIHDIHTPMPLHGLDDLLGIKRSRLPIVAFISGVAGLIFAFWLQIWTSETSWPVIVGGKPFNSFTAFIPVAFELTVLISALTTVAVFFLRTRKPDILGTTLLDLGVTGHTFAIVIERPHAGVNFEHLKGIFSAHGASEVLLTQGAKA